MTLFPIVDLYHSSWLHVCPCYGIRGSIRLSMLSRYVMKVVLQSMLGVLLALLGLETVLAWLGELDALSATYHMRDALIQVCLHAPSSIYELIPVACLIGVLVGLGVLANNSELTVMRAAGVSPLRIVSYTLWPAILFAAVCLILAQYVIPHTERIAQVRKAMIQGGADAGMGYWHREGPVFVHVGLVQGQGKLNFLDFYAYDAQGRLVQRSYAQDADYQQDGWHLFNLQQSDIAIDGQVQVSSIATRPWVTPLLPGFLDMASTDPQFLSLSSLDAYAHFLQQEGLNAAPYQLEFWKKMVQPWATLVMVMLAASIIFGPLRSVTMGLRLVAGVFIGLGFRYGQDFFGFASLIYQFSPFWGAAIPALLAGVLGTATLLRL